MCKLAGDSCCLHSEENLFSFYKALKNENQFSSMFLEGFLKIRDILSEVLGIMFLTVCMQYMLRK